MNATPLLDALQGVQERGQGRWRALCPCHDDSHPSLDVTDKGDKLVCNCPVCGATGLKVCEAVKLDPKVLFESGNSTRSRPRPVDYIYRNADGEPYRRVRKLVENGRKRFYQQRRDGSKWVNKLDGQPSIPYRLPELLQNGGKDTVFVVEGEKDCETLAGLGLVATTNPMGAEKWTPNLNPYFEGWHIVVLPDNDAVGHKHARQVVRALFPLAESIRMLELPELPAKGDVSDWVAAGGTAQQLRDLVLATLPLRELPADEREDPETGEAEGVAPLEVVYLHDRPPKAPTWLVRDILAPESCCLLAAAQKSGKTWWTFLLAICLATGRPFFGREVRQTGRVLLYTPESGWEARRRRLWGLCWGLDLDPREVLQHIPIVRERVNLTAPEHCQRLAATIRLIDPVVTVVDPFVAAAAGIDENSAGEVQPVLDQLRDIAAGPGRALVLAHHHNKVQGGSVASNVRGSTAFGGWWDTLVTVRRQDQDRWDSPRRLDYEHRDARAPDPMGFNILAVAHPDAPQGCTAFRLEQIEAPGMVSGCGVGKGGKQHAEKARRVAHCLALVTEKGTTSVPDLADELEVGPKTIGRYLDELEAAGKVQRNGTVVTQTEKTEE